MDARRCPSRRPATCRLPRPAVFGDGGDEVDRLAADHVHRCLDGLEESGEGTCHDGNPPSLALIAVSAKRSASRGVVAAPSRLIVCPIGRDLLSCQAEFSRVSRSSDGAPNSCSRIYTLRQDGVGAASAAKEAP